MRSGSTILGGTLGEQAGCFWAGETHHIWLGSASPGCGTGERLEECQIWAPVLREVDHRLNSGPHDRSRITELYRASTRLRHFPALLRATTKAGAPPAARRLPEYARAIQILYEELSDITRCPTIIDASKSPSLALILSQVVDIDVKFIHLIRDPLSVAASGAYNVRPPVSGIQSPLRKAVSASITDWLLINEFADRWVRPIDPANWLRVRHEDWVSNPRGVTETITTFAGIDFRPGSFLDDHTVVLGTNHSVGGNPVRRVVGPVQLTDHSAIQEKLRLRERGMICVATAPLRRRYRYR